ncbi:RNA-guided endonuclease InsQ/TnpB family protein [Lentibacillus salicampi]|uniref:Transposase n=1 Tax=Lentibacillus salicampi TaxID=175306 RepID=A0A4Y9A6V5_9BACI|nr:RNA-guided endonuclease TnpB family protein [Lentibacillus salicampi]TFJ91436.1 transposase [Lentibacillus salicampi]
MLTYNKKVRLAVSKENKQLLDSQSRMCNWLYNQLLDAVEEDYQNGSKKKLLAGRNLRNEVPGIKAKSPFLYKVHSSPLKNSALRLKDAYDRYFDKTLANNRPKHRSWKTKWFSLYYDEPKKGFKLVNPDELSLTFGKLTDEELKEARKTDEETKKSIHITVGLVEEVTLSDTESIKTLRITKDLDSYYAIFTIEDNREINQVEEQSFIVFDPNHKNLAVGLASDGKSYELKSMNTLLKYWDKRIDEIKSKRDKCEKFNKLVCTENVTYFEPSKHWKRLNRALEKAALKRREQIKTLLYSYAHYFSKRYDGVYIGDYTPTPDVATYGNMRRAMLNQTPIGQFRSTLSWVQTKNGKHYQKVNERNTTKECCVCGHKEKKDPSIRSFTCVNCETLLSRDISSTVNIGKKAKKLLPRAGYTGVESPVYTVWWDYKRAKVACGLTPSAGLGN